MYKVVWMGQKTNQIVSQNVCATLSTSLLLAGGRSTVSIGLIVTEVSSPIRAPRSSSKMEEGAVGTGPAGDGTTIKKRTPWRVDASVFVTMI